jgi:hypothetical protein
MRIFVLAATALLLITSPNRAAENPQRSQNTLTIEQADDVVHFVFDHRIAHIKGHGGYSLDPYPLYHDKRFYHFDVYGVWHKEQGSALLARFAVNRTTGDVWDVYAECRHVSFPALRKLQAKLRRQYGLPAREPGSIPNHGKPPVLC